MTAEMIVGIQFLIVETILLLILLSAQSKWWKEFAAFFMLLELYVTMTAVWMSLF